ncbi:MAG: HU family DNA-binding protein [Candidatus Omnitrophota bacterium]
MAEKQLIDKKALARVLEQKFDLTHAKSQRIVAKIIHALSDGLVRGERVLLVGFGSFHLQRRKSHRIMHPANRQLIEIPERLALVFRPGKSLKKQLLNSPKWLESHSPESSSPIPENQPPSFAPSLG